MAKAFVLIKTDVGAEKDVIETLKEIAEVKEAHLVYGVYDVIAKVETSVVQGLKDVINLKIRRIEKVKSTNTMICMES